MSKKKDKRIVWRVILSVLAVVLVVGAFGVWNVIDMRKRNFTEHYVLHVYPFMTPSDVLDTLHEAKIVKDRHSLEHAFRNEKLSERLKTGCYVIEATSTNAYVARMLACGWQTPVRLTLSGSIRSKERLATLISKQMMVSYRDVLSALNDDEFLLPFGTDSKNVYSLFLPDTYEVYWDSSVELLFSRMKKEYDKFWTADRARKAKAQGLTPREVSVLASIVSGETNQAKEYPQIASVYLNRLHKDMLLQADPTVAFIYDYRPKRILKKHMDTPSPYNTYKNKGLPPGPICVPPKACIDAVLDPAREDYMYFCADPSFNGTHRFAVTYKEHKKNADEFHKALNARERK